MKYLFLFIFTITSLQSFAQHDVPATDAFEVTGIVKKELKFTVSTLARMKQDNLGDVVMRNHKGEQKSVAHQLKGILLKTILDSAEITAEKPKEYSEYVIVLEASDGYKNVYSWNELYNTKIGDQVYIITEMDGKTVSDMQGRILVMSLGDINSGGRHLKGLKTIKVVKM